MSAVARTGRRLLAALVLLALLAVALPPARAGLKAPGVLAEAIGVGWPRPLAPAVGREPAAVGGVAGDRYASARAGPPVVLVPGATPAGRDDARTVRVASALARAGREVFVPELDLYARELDRRDVERITAAGRAMADRAADGRVALVGFSYGGAFALLAAAEEDLRDHLAVVAVFGAYWDMVGVAQAAATGVSLVDGREIPWDADPHAARIFTEQVVALAPPESRADLRAVLDGQEEPSVLPEEIRPLHDLIVHDDPRRTRRIANRLPTEVRERLAAVSPSAVAGAITAPVVVMHDVDDPAVPYGEALRLRMGLPHARVHAVALFEHVDLDTGGDGFAIAGDLLGAWRFTRSLLAAQEPMLGTLTGRERSVSPAPWRAASARARAPRRPDR